MSQFKVRLQNVIAYLQTLICYRYSKRYIKPQKKTEKT